MRTRLVSGSMAVAAAWRTFTPESRRPPYPNVRLPSPRTPLSTRLLNGQETNVLFGSSITTSMDGSAARTYLAAVAPPQPPPTTTTRRPALGLISPVLVAHPSRPATVSTPTPVPDALRNCLRVIRVICPSPRNAGRRVTELNRGAPDQSRADTTPASSFHVASTAQTART